MTDRVQFGERNGQYGLWVSKPGIDVKTAQPGQFLLDTNSKIFQSVLSGDTLLRVVGNDVATLAATYVQTVQLPSAFAGFSNLVMNAVFYGVSDAGIYYSASNISSGYLKFRATGGAVTLSLVFTVD